MKIYVPNSLEPDFKVNPEVEPSVNHFLLSQKELKGPKIPSVTRVHNPNAKPHKSPSPAPRRPVQIMPADFDEDPDFSKEIRIPIGNNRTVGISTPKKPREAPATK
jgi:hypothetical protein